MWHMYNFLIFLKALFMLHSVMQLVVASIDRRSELSRWTIVAFLRLKKCLALKSIKKFNNASHINFQYNFRLVIQLTRVHEKIFKQCSEWEELKDILKNKYGTICCNILFSAAMTIVASADRNSIHFVEITDDRRFLSLSNAFSLWNFSFYYINCEQQQYCIIEKMQKKTTLRFWRILTICPESDALNKRKSKLISVSSPKINKSILCTKALGNF